MWYNKLCFCKKTLDNEQKRKQNMTAIRKGRLYLRLLYLLLALFMALGLLSACGEQPDPDDPQRSPDISDTPEMPDAPDSYFLRRFSP